MRIAGPSRTACRVARAVLTSAVDTCTGLARSVYIITPIYTPEPYIFVDFPAKNTVCAPYICGSRQPYICISCNPNKLRLIIQIHGVCMCCMLQKGLCRQPALNSEPLAKSCLRLQCFAGYHSYHICHNVCFAGDHLQLPPTVVSDEAARKGLGNTLFKRLQV
jgi:hypothetical protein